MIKEFKRYIDNLSFGQQILIAIIITVISCILFLYSVAIESLLLFPLSIFLFLIDFILGDYIYSKAIFKDEIKEKKELENLFFDSNSKQLEISSSSTYFPEDIVLFYLEQKDTQFWIEYEKNYEKNNETRIAGKIYITDKDSPDKKIEYPNMITSISDLGKYFKVKN